MAGTHRLLILAAICMAAAGCHKQAQTGADQNGGINQPVTNDVLANSDVETLPPDESTTNDLGNGGDDSDDVESNDSQ